jgi:FMN phosphatase YigB (HAD superfamily)
VNAATRAGHAVALVSQQMPSLSTLHGVLFDLDDTLVDRRAALERYLSGLRRRHPLALAEADALEELRRLDDGGRAERDVFCTAAAARFPALGLSPTELWQDFAAGLLGAVEPRAASFVELLRRVATRWPVAVISNGGSARQRAKLARAGLADVIPRLFVSEELGAAKPAPEIFRHALEALELDATRTLFVGDDPERDIAGAHAVGLPTCWIAHGRTYPTHLPLPSLTVACVEDLLLQLAPAAEGARA